MPRFSLVTLDTARRDGADPACSGATNVLTYFDGAGDPLHLHVHQLAPHDRVRLVAADIDQLAYVWKGDVTAEEHRLGSGSSVIVEHGREIELRAGDGAATVLVFAEGQAPEKPRAGGKVHILPIERLPIFTSLAPGSRIGGAIHANAECPTCELWLHENHFPGGLVGTQEGQAGGVHSHAKDEIIFVIEGELQISDRVYGPGTAMAVNANTRYGFTPTNDGLKYINFRPANPGDVTFASGATMYEAALWETLEPKAQPYYA